MSLLKALRRVKSTGLSRRELFRNGGLMAAAGLVPAAASSAPPAAARLSIGTDMYQSIGVRPVINAKGTFTILSGSLMLPECREAMQQASQNFVHMDELMEAVGKRIAEITGAESAIVSSGCAAALVHAASACIAGGNPERIARLPNLTGLKNEVIAPRWSRNTYDHAIRMHGVKFIEVEDEKELRSAIGPKTAMVMVLATTRADGPFGLKEIASVAHEFDVPVLVDAAAEDLTIPNVHLERGADLVAYSGGKALRGPQSAGVLIGRKDLIQAAWLNSAPHHAFGRPMKVGKEDAMGMLAAVEMWVKRDHDAEWKSWESWLDEIGASAKRVSGVTTEILQPRGLSNRSPRLTVKWNGDQIGIYGDELYKHLYNGDPRIVMGSSSGTRRRGGECSVTVMPWQMKPGNAKVVAAELHRVLSNPPKIEQRPKPSGAPADVSGQWDLHIDFVLGSVDHNVFFEQKDDNLMGSHVGEMTSGNLRGWVEGNEVHFASRHRYEGSGFGYTFEGKLSGDTMEGEAELGEYSPYGPVKWTAKRHDYRRRRRAVIRPQKNV
jgi:L-seryl-tRNA(Ser) seleniumtransferase